MATRSDSLPAWLGRALATYSLAVYAVGLVVIALTRVAGDRLGVPFPARARQAAVVVALAVMAVTYLAERRFALDGEVDGEGATSDDEYSLPARAAVAAAAIGVAVAVYLAVALDRFFAGALFIFGAYLFVYMAYRYEDGEGT